MNIEFLYFEDCPGYKSALSLLENILAENDIFVSIEKIEITTQELAIEHQFLGSPSIRINGKDIEGCCDASEYGLNCRIYRDTGSGIPSEISLQKALQQARSNP